MNHVVPVNDLREHITNGDPCPCMPRTLPGVVCHNSYDGREVGQVVRKALDVLGLALANNGHNWSEVERDAYEHALAVLMVHWPA